MRREFFELLHKKMSDDYRIWAVTADLGFGGFDKIRTDFPDRFVNTGASEVTAINFAVGLALTNRIPFVYSITPFLLYRPFEAIRNYIDHEKIPVKLVGSGRDDDYKHDGFSHSAWDSKEIMDCLPNIVTLYPDEASELPGMMSDIITLENSPVFLSLKR